MNVLYPLATGRNIIILLAIFLVANLLIIPAVYPQFQTLDTLPSYAPEEAYRYISSYGEAGRELYIITELSLDLVYPAVTALLFSLAILYTFRRGFPDHLWAHKIALLPFAVLIADYLENASVITLLLGYPRQWPSIARAANFFTMSKFALAPVQLLFVIGLAGWLFRRLHRPPRADTRGRPY